jgi:hypothetical protein
MPKQPTKNGSEHARSGPLFLFTSRFDLPAAYPLTLLLIGRRFFIVQDSLAEKRYCHQHAFDFSEFKTGRRIMIHQ